MIRMSSSRTIHFFGKKRAEEDAYLQPTLLSWLWVVERINISPLSFHLSKTPTTHGKTEEEGNNKTSAPYLVILIGSGLKGPANAGRHLTAQGSRRLAVTQQQRHYVALVHARENPPHGRNEPLKACAQAAAVLCRGVCCVCLFVLVIVCGLVGGWVGVGGRVDGCGCVGSKPVKTGVCESNLGIAPL